MDEYIDLEAATNVACNILWKMNDLSTSVMAKALNSIPAADVAPMVHGWWIYDHWCEFRCSVCGEFSNSEPYRGKENYCPNCGAKMDGGAD